MSKPPKFVVLSGSVRFMEQFQAQYIRIAQEGSIPFTVAGNVKDWPEYNSFKPALDDVYIKVITLFADELFVINVGGYIGESTRHEIEWAEYLGIPVKYLEPIEGKGD